MSGDRRNFYGHRTPKIENLKLFDKKIQKVFFESSLNLKGLEKNFFFILEQTHIILLIDEVCP